MVEFSQTESVYGRGSEVYLSRLHEIKLINLEIIW